jgi:hypothetical protein
MLVGEPLGKRLLGRKRTKWKDNINMAIRETSMKMGSRWNWLRIVSSDGLYH